MVDKPSRGGWISVGTHAQVLSRRSFETRPQHKTEKDNAFNHNYSEVLNSDWLSAFHISAL